MSEPHEAVQASIKSFLVKITPEELAAHCEKQDLIHQDWKAISGKAYADSKDQKKQKANTEHQRKKCRLDLEKEIQNGVRTSDGKKVHSLKSEKKVSLFHCNNSITWDATY